MAEVLLEYRTRMGPNHEYTARAWGAKAADGTNRWRGWIEFVPINGGLSLRTMPETTQPNRTCTVYWASGLRPAYLDGALRRASAHRPGPLMRKETIAIISDECQLEFTPEDRRFLKSLGIAAHGAGQSA